MNKNPLWQTILSTNIASNQPWASQLQKDRWSLLNTQLLPDLHTWARQHELVSIWKRDPSRFRKYAYISSHITVNTVLELKNYPNILEWLSARFILWIFAIDHYLDDIIIGYLLQQNWSIDEKMLYLERELADITEPLSLLGGLTAQQADLLGLQQGLSEQNSRHPRWNQVPHAGDYTGQPDALVGNHRTALRHALTDIYQSFLLHAKTDQNRPEALHSSARDQSLDQAPQHEQSYAFALKTFTYELARCLGSMRYEVLTSLRFHSHRELPDLDTYIDQYTLSIAMVANAALVLAFGVLEEEWKRWHPAALMSARIVRLANDCATYDQDIQEGKVSSVTIALAASGNSVSVQATCTDQQQRTQAVDCIRNIVKMALQHLEELIPPNQQNESSLSSLGRVILCTLAYGLPLFQSNDYTIPKTSGFK